MSERKNKYKILHLSFNKDKNCLAVGMENGYRIYDLTKKDSLFYYERILGKGIGIIEMLEKTNILGLVGGGDDPFDRANKLIIYDDKEGKIIANLTFKSNISNIRIKKDRILVICENYIYLINPINYKSIDTIEIGEVYRKKICFAFTLDPQLNKLAYNKINSLENKNKIIIYTYDKDNIKTSIELFSNYKMNNPITCMDFDKNGKFLAVTARNYRYLEIYKTKDGLKLCLCDMESDSLNTLYISFSLENEFLCTSLNTGEVIIFNIKSVLNASEEDVLPLNDINNNNKIKEEIWSRFYLPEQKSICAFGSFLEEFGERKEYIITVGYIGNYYLVNYDKENKQNLALKIREKYFLKPEDDLYAEEIVHIENNDTN